MIAKIKLYEDKDEGLTYEQMQHQFCTSWEASLSDSVWQWVANNAAYIKGGVWVIDGDDLILFEDWYTEAFGGYPFMYSHKYESQALTFEMADNYGLKFFKED